MVFSAPSAPIAARTTMEQQQRNGIFFAVSAEML
jgi:hypothetical protein